MDAVLLVVEIRIDEDHRRIIVEWGGYLVALFFAGNTRGGEFMMLTPGSLINVSASSF